MSRATGSIEFVQVRFSGGNLVADAAVGASVLSLDMVTDFDYDDEANLSISGQLMLNEATYDYTAVDYDLGTVTLATTLTEAAEVGDPVRVLDVLGLPEPERIAWVDLDDGDPVPAEVRTDLAPYFPEGLSISGQLVDIELIDGDGARGNGVDASLKYQVANRPFQDASFQASVRATDEDGNILGGVGPNGITGRDIFYEGSFWADTNTMWWDGVTAGELLNLLPKGLIAPWGVRNPNITKIANTEYAVMSLLIYVQRDCEALLLMNGRVAGSVERTRFTMRVRDSFNALEVPPVATNTSPILAALDGSNPLTVADNTSGLAGSQYSINVSRGVQLKAGWHDLRWTFEVLTLDATLDTTGDFAMRIYDQGPVMLSNGAYPPPSPGTLAAGGTDFGSAATGQLQVYTRDYSAVAGRWWDADDVLLGSTDTLNFGNTPEVLSGNRRAAIWFDGAKLAKDLSGATVTKVQVYLYLHQGGSDNTVLIGTHTDSVVRANYPNIVGKVTDRVRSTGWSAGSGRWVDLPFSISSWKNSFQGLIIGPAPTGGGESFAGGIRGATHPSRPRLRITFTR